MKKTLFAVIALSLAVVSCEKSHLNVPDDGAMHFNAVHPSSLTKATSSNFESGDKIGVFVVEYLDDGSPAPLQIAGNWANNVSATFDGSAWNTSSRIFWSDKPVDVYAYYPYQSLVSVDDQFFSVVLDQNAPKTSEFLSGYEASDFLWAKTSGVTVLSDSESANPVQLQFSHIMSKIVVKLIKGKDFEGEFPDDGILTLHSTIPSAQIDLALGVAVKDPFGVMTSIKMRRVSNDTFEAVVVPQRLETRRPFIEYEANGVSFLLEDTFNFKPGMLYTYNLTINSSPEQISVEIGGEIGGWN